MANEKTRQAHRQRLAAMKKADADEPMPESKIAELKGAAAELMLEGESVTRALQRLGGGSKKPVLKSKNKKKKEEESGGSSQPADPANTEKFNQLTEIVDTLLEAGEMDIYRETKHILEREAAIYKRPSFLDRDDGSGGGGMFADDSEDEDVKPAKRPASEAAKGAATSSAAGTAPSGPGGSSSDATDYSSWPVKELQRFLRERGQDPTGAVEKSDLVAQVKAAASVPSGYVFHAESGYYWGAADSMYYHAETGHYYNPVSSEWCYWDGASRKFMPNPASG